MRYLELIGADGPNIKFENLLTVIRGPSNKFAEAALQYPHDGNCRCHSNQIETVASQKTIPRLHILSSFA